MYELFVTGASLPEAYHASILALHEKHDTLPCPDYNTRQHEASVTFVAENPAAEPMISRLFIGDPRALEQYRQEMLDGILDFEVDRGNWEYTYHRRMENQFDWIRSELRRNPDTRRAIISVRDEEDIRSGSPACLQSVQYLIRGGALHCKVLFRSNDAVKAAFMNAFALACLQKRFADELGVPSGSYTHRANSYHVYERDWELFDGYVRRLKSGGEVTYPYAGGWDELMDDAKPEIAEFVRRQREKL
ncbi:MAG: thymidylate synthase [Oscillospiraceae bacterium]|jgi:thymidylate synthase|nr:thymidylate synthase [Oscillospiraceae bacterium]